MTVAAAVILGGIGFPVLVELKQNLRRPKRWSLHTKLTLSTTALLLVAAMIAFEWTNPGTLGPLGTADSADSAMASFFQSVMPRTAGFNSIDTGTLVLVSVSDFRLGRSLFEAFSAFGTVGLSTGITASLPDTGQLTLIALMFIGRVGPITLFAALVLRQRQRLYHLPEERPIIGGSAPTGSCSRSTTWASGSLTW